MRSTANFIAAHVAGNQSAVWFSIEAPDGTYVGNIWLWDLHWRYRRAEVRVFVAHPQYQHRGIGTAAIAAIAKYAFETLGLHKLYAYVHVSNEGSRRAFENAGFWLEATLREDAYREGSFTDVIRFARIAGESRKGT